MNVLVELENAAWKKCSIKTTPIMTLETIKNQACEKLSLDPTFYGLKFQKKLLDLNLSVRFSQLPNSAKLYLSRIGGSNADPLTTGDVESRILVRLMFKGTIKEEFHAFSSSLLRLKLKNKVLGSFTVKEKTFISIDELMDETFGEMAGNSEVLEIEIHEIEPKQDITDQNQDVLSSFKVYKPSDTQQEFNVPDSFFELSGEEVKALMKAHQHQVSSIENKPLMTAALREKLDHEKMQKFPKTMIRVRFPDGLFVQQTYSSTEKVSVLFEQVKQLLLNPQYEFELYVSPPKQSLLAEKTFYESKLAPASIVHFSWLELVSGPILKQEIYQMQETLPFAKLDYVPPQTALPSVNHGPSSTSSYVPPPKEDDNKKTKLPKWLKFNK